MRADLQNIASVTEADTAKYLAAAVDHGAGYGSCGGYRFLVTRTEDGRSMAIFLECSQSRRAVRTVLVWSLAADEYLFLLEPILMFKRMIVKN